MTLTNSNRANQFAVRVALLALLVALAVASRMGQVVCSWLPPNFHAVAGTALFAGFLFRGRAVALLVPFAAMWLSDQILGGYDRLVMTAVYGSLAAPVLVGHWLERRLSARPRRRRVAGRVDPVLFGDQRGGLVGLVSTLRRWPGPLLRASGSLFRIHPVGRSGLCLRAVRSLLAVDRRRSAAGRRAAPADSRPLALPV